MTTRSSTHQRSPFGAILLAGLSAGTLDAIAASISYYSKTGKTPGNVWRYVATGVFGKKVFASATLKAAWGLLFHFMIAFLFALFFFWLYPRLKWLSRNKVIGGLLYGIFIWLVMNLLVVPLSQARDIPFTIKGAAIGMLILMFCVGLPISLIAGYYYSRSSRVGE